LDILPRVSGPLSNIEQLRFARLCSVLIGVISTFLAGFVHLLGTLFELTQIILGVFAGPLLVVVLLSVTERRISSKGMIAGLIGGCLAGWVVALSPVAPLWTSPIAAGCTLLIAELFPAPAASPQHSR
jgi:Na+/proline symporter